MKTVIGLESLEAPQTGTAVTIGTFDGIHLGHRALIARTVATAQQDGLESAVVTWDRHPNTTLRPDKVPPLLTSQERKIELFEDLKQDLLVVLPFTRELSLWPPERFAKEVLAVGLGAKSIIVGRGWKFGHGGVGDVDLLSELGRDLGFEVQAIDLESAAGGPVSSSRVREAVARGDLELARELLLRPFDVDGIVEHGDDRGKSLGFPTANLSVDPRIVRPPRGVYAGRAHVDDQWYVAAINVGVNPTFGGDPDTSPIRIEAYLIDFDDDLYGRTVRVEFWQRLRDEQNFVTADALIEQMKKDVAETMALVEPD
jgi:riboflavin kinase / FMN adenylyltransferase